MILNIFQKLISDYSLHSGTLYGPYNVRVFFFFIAILIMKQLRLNKDQEKDLALAETFSGWVFSLAVETSTTHAGEPKVEFSDANCSFLLESIL